MKNLCVTLTLFMLATCSSVAQPTSIYFDTDQSELTPDAQLTLDSVLAFLSANSVGAVDVSCHCDSRADSLYNYRLSINRGEAVKRYLVHTNPILNIRVSAHGEDDPAFNNSAQERFKNRRCDLYVAHGNVQGHLASKPVQDWQPGDLLRLEGVEFVANQAVPNSYSMPQLYQLLNILRHYPALSIALHGHVCCSNDLPLSQARAQAVQRFLIDNGINHTRISAQGFSNTRPVVKEVDEQTKQQNRRVEVLVRKAPENYVDVDTIATPIFTVQLFEIQFKKGANTLLSTGTYNLSWLASMIADSHGYFYELAVYSRFNGDKQKRFRAVQQFFRKQKLDVKKLKIKPGNEKAYQHTDVLILKIFKT